MGIYYIMTRRGMASAEPGEIAEYWAQEGKCRSGSNQRIAPRQDFSIALQLVAFDRLVDRLLGGIPTLVVSQSCTRSLCHRSFQCILYGLDIVPYLII